MMSARFSILVSLCSLVCAPALMASEEKLGNNLLGKEMVSQYIFRNDYSQYYSFKYPADYFFQALIFVGVSDISVQRLREIQNFLSILRFRGIDINLIYKKDFGEMTGIVNRVKGNFDSDAPRHIWIQEHSEEIAHRVIAYERTIEIYDEEDCIIARKIENERISGAFFALRNTLNPINRFKCLIFSLSFSTGFTNFEKISFYHQDSNKNFSRWNHHFAKLFQSLYSSTSTFSQKCAGKIS